VLALSLIAIAVTATLGLMLGSHQVPAQVVWEAVTNYDAGNNQHLIVIQSRLPRTIVGLIAGGSLALSGAIMQSLTRNPLADPGILGVNAGASAAVVIAIAYLGVSTINGYIWFAFIGAAGASVLVYALGNAQRGAGGPARIALAGSAVTIAISAVTNMVLISNELTFSKFRYWTVGSLQGRDLDVSTTVLPFVLAGAVLALCLAPSLNALSLGEETARSLGSRTRSVRALAAVCVVLTAGAATAAVGPIGFIGLAAPHVVRKLVGPNHTYLLPASMCVGAAFLLLADVLGRIVVAPGEIQTGIAAAALGGPIFILLVRSRSFGAL
jgi:iron complex transport system permease protein